MPVPRIELAQVAPSRPLPPVSTVGTLGPIHFSWDHPGTKTSSFMALFSRLGSVRATESSEFMERAMGIEPTSEAWEACCRQSKTHKLAAICCFLKFSNGF